MLTAPMTACESLEDRIADTVSYARAPLNRMIAHRMTPVNWYDLIFNFNHFTANFRAADPLSDAQVADGENQTLVD